MDGNTRALILKDRGIDIDKLPAASWVSGRSALRDAEYSSTIDPFHFKSGVYTVPEASLPGLNRAIQGGVQVAYR